MNSELVIQDMKFVELLLLRVCNLFKCSYRGYVIFLIVVVEDMQFVKVFLWWICDLSNCYY